jgi:hypothetical protein
MYMSASIALFGAHLLIPVSDQVPTFNIEPSCKGAAAATAQMAGAQSFSACMAEENEARHQLVSTWQSFSAAHRTRCSAEASGQGLASYVELLVCLQIASGGNMQPTLLKGARKKP